MMMNIILTKFIHAHINIPDDTVIRPEILQVLMLLRLDNENYYNTLLNPDLRCR